MPAIETVDRHDDAIWWPITGRDDNGQPLRGSRVALKVRVNIGRTESTDADGNTISLDALAVVDRRIDADDLMVFSSIDDWDETGSAGSDAEIYRVASYKETKDIKGRSVRREVGLKRWMATMPAVG